MSNNQMTRRQFGRTFVHATMAAAVGSNANTIAQDGEPSALGVTALAIGATGLVLTSINEKNMNKGK